MESVADWSMATLPVLLRPSKTSWIHLSICNDSPKVLLNPPEKDSISQCRQRRRFNCIPVFHRKKTDLRKETKKHNHRSYDAPPKNICAGTEVRLQRSDVSKNKEL
jgi:hypothetical protein